LVGVEKDLDINTEVKVNVGANENSSVSAESRGGKKLRRSTVHWTLQAV